MSSLLSTSIPTERDSVSLRVLPLPGTDGTTGEIGVPGGYLVTDNRSLTSHRQVVSRHRPRTGRDFDLLFSSVLGL